MRPAGDSGSAKTVLAAFSVEHRPRAPVAQKVLPSGDYPGLEAIAIEYVAEVDLSVTHACLAVPGPVSSCGAGLEERGLADLPGPGRAGRRLSQPAARGTLLLPVA
jgi:hypothetical protein